MKDKEAVEAFNSLVSIKVGDSAKTLFWTDRWVRGSTTMELAPAGVCDGQYSEKKQTYGKGGHGESQLGKRRWVRCCA
jgi:hypothetical protein